MKIIVVYKVDRLTRSLADFAKLVERFDARGVSFVSVTQQFNTTTSMGRLTLNVLLSFAQFEREVTGERIRDKIAASKRKGLWMGGIPPMGYKVKDRSLVIDLRSAERIRQIFRLYLELGCVRRLKDEVDVRDWRTARRNSTRPGQAGGRPFSRGHLYRILTNPVYRGLIDHKGTLHPGQHPAIIDERLWNEVQASLKIGTNGQNTGGYRIDQSMLGKIIYDSNGDRLTPGHASKGSLRYRYYVSRDLHEGRRHGNGTSFRIPAAHIEKAVIDAVTEFLGDGRRLAECIADAPAKKIREALAHARQTRDALTSAVPGSPECRALVHRLVQRVTVAEGELQVLLRAEHLLADPGNEGPAPIPISYPFDESARMRSRGVVLRPKGEEDRKDDCERLVALLDKAQTWFNRLAAEGGGAIHRIALEQSVTAAYVARMIQLAFLSPRIAAGVRNGSIGARLTSQKLLAMMPVADRWDEQERNFLPARP